MSEIDDDCWNDGPEHPHHGERFDVAYTAYPGGEDAFWRDFRAAAITYYWHYREEYLADGGPDTMTDAEWAADAAYTALRRRVHRTSKQVAEQAGLTSREIAHWLVKDKGFPWREDCDWNDLRCMLALLEHPDTAREACFAPNYPDRRDHARRVLRDESRR